MSIQDLICQAIAKLPANATLKEVSTRLDPIVLADPQANSSELDVTALMVACDKGQADCLEYMLMNPNPQLWGRADARSSLQNGANTAFHHAAVAGCLEALDAFEAMGCSLRDLAQLTNEHGDTPVMMACVSNRISFLQRLKMKLGNDSFSESLQTKNASKDTALTLAFFRGHAEVVKLLLSSGLEVSYEVVRDCSDKLRDLDAILSTSGGTKRKEIQFHRSNVAICLEMMESKLAQNSQKSMEDLLQKEAVEKALKQPSAVTKQRGKANRRNDREKKRMGDKSLSAETSQKVCDKQRIQSIPETSQKIWDKQRIQSIPVKDASQPKFRTLLDGSVVKSGGGLQLIDVSVESHSIVDAAQPKSVDEMLRKCLRESRNHDSSIDAVMDALCLDASMLLLSPHGMAINLSPSQLETIDSILRQQIKSVQDARQIQERLLSAGRRIGPSL